MSLISQTGVHQLHIFLFVLAIFHVLYSVITMALGQAKVSSNSITSSPCKFVFCISYTMSLQERSVVLYIYKA